MISGGDDREARKRYSSFVMSGILKDMNITLWEGVRGQTILGGDDFVDWVRERFLSNIKGDQRGLPELRALEKAPGTMEEIAREVAVLFGVKEKELYRRHASAKGSRAVFIELCRLYLSRQMSLSEIGRRLGNVSVAALSQNKKRLSAKIRKDETLRARFGDLKKHWD